MEEIKRRVVHFLERYEEDVKELIRRLCMS